MGNPWMYSEVLEKSSIRKLDGIGRIKLIEEDNKRNRDQ
jgi:hypothetical protein